MSPYWVSRPPAAMPCPENSVPRLSGTRDEYPRRAVQNCRRAILGKTPQNLIGPDERVIAALVAAESVRSRRDGVPYYMVALIFAATFGTLAISFWPYMIPFSITIQEAAAPHSSLAFMFWGEGLFVFPL